MTHYASIIGSFKSNIGSFTTNKVPYPRAEIDLLLPFKWFGFHRTFTADLFDQVTAKGLFRLVLIPRFESV
jgi:hypothetical protein